MPDLSLAEGTTHAERHVPRSWIKPYYGSFNGLRGLAVLMVFFCHYGGPAASITGDKLWVGVDLFFVLSGFLITGILYDSLEDSHYFRNFYTRRALRIFPIFYGFFLALLILTPILHLHYHRNFLSFVFYVGNLTVPFTNLVLHNPTIITIFHHGHVLEVGNIGHLWSLCVEEQFYLIWPALVWAIRDRRRLMYLCAIVSVATLAGRFYLQGHASAFEIKQYILYWSTYTRCDTLLIGSWIALFLRGRVISAIGLRRTSGALFCTSIALLILGEYHWGSQGVFNNPFTNTIGFTLIALAAAGVLLRALDDDSWLSRALRFQPLSWLGTISYGFYFYHAIPFKLWMQLAGLHPALKNAIPLLAFFSTVAVAWISFRFYEMPFLRLKKVLAPQQIRPKREATG